MCQRVDGHNPAAVPCCIAAAPDAAARSATPEWATAFLVDAAAALDAAAGAAASSGREQLALRHRFAAITVRELLEPSPPC